MKSGETYTAKTTNEKDGGPPVLFPYLTKKEVRFIMKSAGMLGNAKWRHEKGRWQPSLFPCLLFSPFQPPLQDDGYRGREQGRAY
ncbi:hypothetical protein HMPREF3224_02117 [Anaerococcus hydrogenalis]|nr:hypothetical protein HMPREF3224_02117 [Anaerococcus hydrogenalis]